ncbi:hypothetical protein BD410DRAFT_730160 [Rickenella mellea]|uniref:DUF6589 domain-containing protein n=1 Tax=Rickenella mellea TaxID=50990 RepID=A0A4Y7PR31_9AGAM|nr:hypothetical protein BD410DRAFT_730160 [Rickenella mellea]
MINLSLPAHTLDALEVLCGKSSLATWVSSVEDYEDVKTLARKVKDELFSAARVEKLRLLPAESRDIILENVILFNRDAVILREFTLAVKTGDIGRVMNVLAYWMVMFRGTGSMPKYADALFYLLKDLKTMKPELRNAFLMNWLVNTTGLKDRFKEIDLLQEHQNFWAKDLQVQYNIPHNGNSHTSPCTETDINTLRKYLHEHKIQSYEPKRPDNEHALPVRDLMETGGAYAWTSSAFRNFRRENYSAKTNPTDASTNQPEGAANTEDTEQDDTDIDELNETEPSSIFDLDLDAEITGEDLGLDRDTAGNVVDLSTVVQAMREIIDDL